MKERHARLTGDTPAAPAAERTLPLGEAMAAFVAAGIGSLALGIIVLSSKPTSSRCLRSTRAPERFPAARPSPRWYGW